MDKLCNNSTYISVWNKWIEVIQSNQFKVKKLIHWRLSLKKFHPSLFDSSCLTSWLEQDTSCPTCRTSLSEGQQVDPNSNVPDERGAAPPQPPQQQPQNMFTNHFFHFDGKYLFFPLLYTVNQIFIRWLYFTIYQNCFQWLIFMIKM